MDEFLIQQAWEILLKSKDSGILNIILMMIVTFTYYNATKILTKKVEDMSDDVGILAKELKELTMEMKKIVGEHTVLLKKLTADVEALSIHRDAIYQSLITNADLHCNILVCIAKKLKATEEVNQLQLNALMKKHH